MTSSSRAGSFERHAQRGAGVPDAGVVDDDLDIGQPLRHRGDLPGVGDVELDRDKPRVGDRGGVADACVDLARAAGQELLGDRLADAAIGAGYQSY